MLLIRDDSLISFPEITEDDALLEVTRNVLPEFLASSDTTSAYDAGDDLSGLFAKGKPNPTLLL